MCTNGPNWSNDGKKFYFVCSADNAIREYKYDVNTSTIKGPARVVIKFDDKWGGPGGLFDGGTVDTEGYLWWALNGAGKVIRIEPNSGRVERVIQLQAACPTSVAFGGPDYKTLMVTFMGKNPRPGTEKFPNGGVALVRFSDQSIQGVPANKLKYKL